MLIIVLSIFALGILDSFFCESVPKHNNLPHLKEASAHALFYLMTQCLFCPFTAVLTFLFMFFGHGFLFF